MENTSAAEAGPTCANSTAAVKPLRPQPSNTAPALAAAGRWPGFAPRLWALTRVLQRLLGGAAVYRCDSGPQAICGFSRRGASSSVARFPSTLSLSFRARAHARAEGPLQRAKRHKHSREFSHRNSLQRGSARCGDRRPYRGPTTNYQLPTTALSASALPHHPALLSS